MERTEENKLEVKFYRTLSGSEPVREWLKSIEFKDRKIIGNDIKTVQYGFPIGMPLVRPMGSGLYEVRSDLNSKKISRVFFCIENEKIILLHGFIKKSQQTPDNELEIARKRYKEIKQGY
jgi:phage-related protein